MNASEATIVIVLAVSGMVISIWLYSIEQPLSEPMTTTVLFKQQPFNSCVFEAEGSRHTVQQCLYVEGEQMTVQKYGNGWRVK